jgi:hypothetical protein
MAGADLIKDDEGSEHATLDHARSQALKTARELWADAIKSGKPLEADAILIADEQGQLTFVPMYGRSSAASRSADRTNGVGRASAAAK